MSTHNICFRREIRKIFTGYPPLSRPMPLHILLLETDKINALIFYPVPLHMCAVWYKHMQFSLHVHKCFNYLFYS